MSVNAPPTAPPAAPKRRAKQRIEEQHADQQAPETARNGPRRRRIDDLMQLDLPVGGFRRNDRVAKLDQIFLLQFEEALAHLFRFFL